VEAVLRQSTESFLTRASASLRLILAHSENLIIKIAGNVQKYRQNIISCQFRAMLLQFSVSNFRGLRDLQELNLSAKVSDKSLSENVVKPEYPGLKGRHWLKGAALYGANASGKTTVIEAMEALSNWVGNSAKTTDPEEAISYIEPYALDPDSAKEPSAFAIVFVEEGIRYEYRVAATRHLIHHESLRAWPVGKEQVWFERDWNPETGKHVFTPDNPTGLPRSRDIEQRTLRNMLYLSKAVAEARSEVEPVFRWLVRRFKFLDLSTRTSFGSGFTLKQLDGENKELKTKITEALRHADIGIVDAFAIEGAPLEKNFFEMLKVVDPKAFAEFRDKGATPKRMEPQLVHKGPKNSKVPLNWERESAGTHRLFSLIGPWLDILEKGYTVCIDEIETSMHPTMVRELLKLFFSQKENTGGAQIIFTTHNALLLDNTLIRRDQVWFTDKDDEGAVHLYPLTDYKPRGGESLIRGYMAGRYGAVPFIPRGLLGSFVPDNQAQEGEGR